MKIVIPQIPKSLNKVGDGVTHIGKVPVGGCPYVKQISTVESNKWRNSKKKMKLR